MGSGFRYAGFERLTLLLIGESTLAATLAWVVSFYGLDAQSPAFAPFSAVMIMHVTIYQSVVQSLRYVGSVAAGVAVQAVLSYPAGPDLLTFVLVAVIALSVGRSRLLGVQGPQVATAAFLAFSTYSSATDDTTRVAHLGESCCWSSSAVPSAPLSTSRSRRLCVTAVPPTASGSSPAPSTT